MRKIFLIYFLCSLLVALTALFGNKLKNQDGPQKLPKYLKVEIEGKFPKPFQKLDSLFEERYNLPASIATKDIPQNMLMEFAKNSVWIHMLPAYYFDDFITHANRPKREQSKRERNARKNGQSFNEELVAFPGGMYADIIKVIKQTFPWQWKFHMNIRYILIVEPIKKERRLIEMRFRDLYTDFYYCNTTQDVKGNFKKLDPILLAKHVKTKVHMELGEQYLVLIYRKGSNQSEHGNYYVIDHPEDRGDGAYLVQSGIINDPNKHLRMNKTKIPIIEFKNNVSDFIHKIAGVPYEY